MRGFAPHAIDWSFVRLAGAEGAGKLLLIVLALPRTGIIAFAAITILAGCRSESPSDTPPVNAPADCNWAQWGHDAAHGGTGCAPGQNLNRVLGQVTIDPFVDLEMIDTGGDLLARYQVPLLVNDDVYIEIKSGAYVPCPRDADGNVLPDAPLCGNDARDTLIHNERRLHWESGALVEKWTFASDWKPVSTALAEFGPVFQSAVRGDAILVPGAGGTVFELDRITGVQRTRHNPFGNSLDPNAFVVGGITVDGDGNAFFNAVRFATGDPA